MSAVKATTTLSPAHEKRFGAAIAPLIFRRYGPLVDDAELLAYLARVGVTVATRSNKDAHSFRFALIDNKEASAFALPGGYIFVTTTLLQLCENEAELAALLAHEVAHVTARHLIIRLRATKGGNNIEGILSRGNKKEIETLARKAADILFTKGVGQKQEYEADRLGIAYATLAGYDSHALPYFLERLTKEEGTTHSVFFKTHPLLAKRLAHIRRKVLQKYQGGGRYNAERFDRQINPH